MKGSFLRDESIEESAGARVDDRLNTDLLRATSILSVPGRESRAIAFVRSRLESLPNVEIRVDRFSQIHARMNPEPRGHPTYWVAHLDHPGFIVEMAEGCSANLIFRGSCDHLRPGKPERPAGIRIDSGSGWIRARMREVRSQGPSYTRVSVTTQEPVQAGDLGVFEFDAPARIEGGRLHAPACDDMAGACAVLSAFESLAQGPAPAQPVRLLFTRAEEVGLLGAIAACKDRLLPPQSSIICVDGISVSKIDRAGDVTAPILIPADSVMSYSPRLLRHFASLGEVEPARLREQGASEAGVFALWGFESLAIFFSAGNLHNFDASRPGIPVLESVSIREIESVRDLLVRSARHPPGGASLRETVDDAWREWSSILLRPP